YIIPFDGDNESGDRFFPCFSFPTGGPAKARGRFSVKGVGDKKKAGLPSCLLFHLRCQSLLNGLFRKFMTAPWWAVFLELQIRLAY
ncbi:MAG: hypothetical protein IJS52_10605, partial [Bacilli bacterium]|nr:hypothetical protein [Bacilli bacterium]